jgi:hypothetical protein
MVENGLQVTRAWRSFFSLGDSSDSCADHSDGVGFSRAPRKSKHARKREELGFGFLGTGATHHCLHYTFCSQCVP